MLSESVVRMTSHKLVAADHGHVIRLVEVAETAC